MGILFCVSQDFFAHKSHRFPAYKPYQLAPMSN
jgi:hypothetical protein